jgi:hypothetical protein
MCLRRREFVALLGGAAAWDGPENANVMQDHGGTVHARWRCSPGTRPSHSLSLCREGKIACDSLSA